MNKSVEFYKELEQYLQKVDKFMADVASNDPERMPTLEQLKEFNKFLNYERKKDFRKIKNN